jgi:hypothetical protein
MALTAERLRELLVYTPETGEFHWAVSKGAARRGGLAGGSVGGTGYLNIGIDGKLYRTHRLAWLYVYGEWPENEIDHINLVKTDNRIKNLRQASHTENMANKPVYKNNVGGLKGVRKRGQKWHAQIQSGGKIKFIGSFSTPEMAAAAYSAAAQEMFGEFARAA